MAQYLFAHTATRGLIKNDYNKKKPNHSRDLALQNYLF